MASGEHVVVQKLEWAPVSVFNLYGVRRYTAYVFKPLYENRS